MSASLDPHRKLNNCVTMTYTVATGQTVRGGFAVRLAADDQEIQEAGANSELAIGVAAKPGKTYAAGATVEVYLGPGVVPMVVGTGGITRGLDVRMIADGITDCPAWDAAGATVVPVLGKALQSAVAGDHVGVLLGATLAYRIAT